MNVNEYISSGVLESYALGLCNSAEAAEVERMCALYPEVKAELVAIQASLEGYAQSHAMKPAAEVKENIFRKIDEIEQQAPSAKVVSISPVYKYLVAASVALLVLSMAGNIIIYSKWKKTNEELVALSNEKNVMAENLRSNQVKLEGMERDMAMVNDPAFKRVMMKSMKPAMPQSLAFVYWNNQTKEVYLAVENLPAPAEGMQYQLWAIVDGKPVDAGMITLTEGDSSMHKMKDFENAQAFAITLEKQGGSPVPNVEEMYVMGGI